MSKRKLNRQQQDRIDQRQAQKIQNAQRALGADTPEPEGDLGPETPGQVICHYGQQLEVESLGEDSSGLLVRCQQRANLPPLVSGDRVVWQAQGETSGVVVALNERQNIFSRPGFGGELKPVASNVDWVLIVLAPLPRPHMNLVDRYLVAVETLGLHPVLVFNKCELPEADLPEYDSMLSIYHSLDYPVYRVSARSGVGMAELRDKLRDSTAVIVGQSGVGKSSLINALSPGLAAQVGDLSRAGPKGTHTTTTARLFHGDGHNLIDSPGIREFNLWHISLEQLLEGFVEFRPWIGQCRFRDCQHGSEPDCALRQAALRGDICPRRMESFQQIRSTLLSEADGQNG